MKSIVPVMSTAEYEARTFPCGGEAHDPRVGGMIDNCGRCAPRWGKVPAHKSLTCEERWVLMAIGSQGGEAPLAGIPREPFESLRSKGLATDPMVTETGKGLTTSFFVARLTPFGAAAYEAIKRSRRGVRRVTREEV